MVPALIVLPVVVLVVLAWMLWQHLGLPTRAARLADEWQQAQHELHLMRAASGRARRRLRTHLHRAGSGTHRR